MKSALMRLLYKKGGKGTSILVKHFAEQINGDADHPPPGFPKEGMDKVVPEFGLHTKANKPARLMKRGGRTVRPSSSLCPCSPLSLSLALFSRLYICTARGYLLKTHCGDDNHSLFANTE